jgi:hypothetical protein
MAQLPEKTGNLPEDHDNGKAPEMTKARARAPESTPESAVQQHAEQLDEDEKEFRALRRDVPNPGGASAAGMQAISVDKAPKKNAFIRTHPKFRPIVPIVIDEVRMDRHYYAVSPEMVGKLGEIGIKVADHTLYLTINDGGGLRIVPIRRADEDGEQHEASRTKELGLIKAINAWHRLYWDEENNEYRAFPAPKDRYGEPVWPDLTDAKIFRLSFRDKGRLIDGAEHPLFRKWAGRDE